VADAALEGEPALVVDHPVHEPAEVQALLGDDLLRESAVDQHRIREDVAEQREALAEEALAPHEQVAVLHGIEPEGEDLAFTEAEDVDVEAGPEEHLQVAGDRREVGVAARAPAQDVGNDRGRRRPLVERAVEKDVRERRLELVRRVDEQVDAARDPVRPHGLVGPAYRQPLPSLSALTRIRTKPYHHDAASAIVRRSGTD